LRLNSGMILPPILVNPRVTVTRAFDGAVLQTIALRSDIEAKVNTGIVRSIRGIYENSERAQVAAKIRRRYLVNRNIDGLGSKSLKSRLAEKLASKEQFQSSLKTKIRERSRGKRGVWYI